MDSNENALSPIPQYRENPTGWSKGIGSKYFLNSEFNCNYVTKVKLHVTTEVNIGHLV